MVKASKEKPIYIDALSFAQPRKSGVGHIAEELSLALEKSIRSSSNKRKVCLVVPLRKAKFVKKYENDIVKVKTIPLPGKILHVLNKWNILPPLDIFLGAGDYVFPNYRNWRLAFSRSFTYIHDLSYFHYAEFVEPKNLAYLKKNVPTWIKRADKIITASYYTKQEIIKYLHVESSDVAVVPHGVDMSAFKRHDKREYRKVLESYGIKVDRFVLHIGNIEPRKNILGLIAAYAALPEKIKKEHALVLIGGDGWLNEKEKQAIAHGASKGLSILQPNRYVEDEDLPYFYSAAGALAMPSFYEGFGVPPLQAIACGTPTVVANNSSLRELFEGVAYMTGTSSGLITDNLRKALMMTPAARRQYAVKAKKLAEKYSWEASAKKLLEVIDR